MANFSIEERFCNAKFKIPKIDYCSKSIIEKELKIWLGKIISLILSHGFKLFENGELNEKRVQIYCCENIMYNIIEVVKENNLGLKELSFINDYLEK